MDDRAPVDKLLRILSQRLEEIRETYPQEEVYEAFAGEVEAREGDLTTDQRLYLHQGAEALLVAAGL